MSRKFDPRKLERLNDPERLVDVPPADIWRKLNIPDCRVVVDLGAGTGLFSRAFLPMMNGGTIYAADVSEQMIDWMNENVTADHPGIVPLLMEESRVPLDNATADLTILINLYHELEDPAATLRDVHRVLKSEGRICIIDWKKEQTDHGPPVEWRFDVGEIARELRSVGFRNVQTDLSMRNHSMAWAQKPPAAG